MIHAGLQLGSILKKHGIVTEEHVAAAVSFQNRKGCRLGEALVALALCSEADVARGLAEQNGIGYVDLDLSPPSREALRRLPREVAVEYGIVPLRLDGRRLVVVARDPYDLRIDEVVRKHAGMSVTAVCGADSQIRDYLSRYDELKWSLGSMPEALQHGDPGASSWDAVPPGLWDDPAPKRRRAAPAAGMLPDPETSPAGQKVLDLLAQAVNRRATEVYFQAGEGELEVRCRIDGRTQLLATLPAYRAQGILRHLRQMAGAAGDEETRTVSGPAEVALETGKVDLRVSVVPGQDGPVGMLQIVRPEDPVRSLDGLGLDPDAARVLRRSLAVGHGLVLVAGPAGAGVPTTLRAIRAALESAGAQVVALESTFERRLRGAGEVVQPDGRSEPFAVALETALSRKVDAVLVGELPDRLSAELACRAAATGSLVIVGCSAAGPVEAISRLLGLGVPSLLVSAALAVVLSQRLVRRNCEACAEEVTPSGALDGALREIPGYAEQARFMAGRGCAACGGTGTRGVTGVFQVLTMDDTLRGLLAAGGGMADFRAALAQAGLPGLEEAALRKAARGQVAPAELGTLGMSVSLALADAGEVSPAPRPLVEASAASADPAPSPFTAPVEASDWSSVPF